MKKPTKNKQCRVMYICRTVGLVYLVIYIYMYGVLLNILYIYMHVQYLNIVYDSNLFEGWSCLILKR